MSVWGKIIGSASGFAFAGPIGAVIGAVAGHAIDKVPSKDKLPEEIAIKQIGFTIGVIVLSAKMAKADGNVTKEEIIAFRKKVNVPNNEIKNVGRLWDQAKKTTDGFDIYAKQIASLFEAKSAVLEELLNLLFFIAKADGIISSSESIYLEKVSTIFGFTDEDFNRIYSSNTYKTLTPYQVLGVAKSIPLEEIKKKWKKLAISHHPDNLVSKGLPEDFIQKSTSRLQEINNAWDIIQQNK
jgi:DnaJ like chaperone protein